MRRILLSEQKAYELLRKHGVSVPANRIVKRKEDAAKVAREIGFPVVMKIVSPQVIHKSDVGGVITGVESEKEAERSFVEIINRVKNKKPEAEIKGVIVEKQMPPGLELIVGGKSDQSFGKVISFGLGGKLVEFMKDVVLRVLPLNRNEISNMIREIKGYTLIRGYRDETPKDEETLVNTIKAVSELFYEDKDLIEFDINPLMLYEKGACSVDARLIIGEKPDYPDEEPHQELSQEIFYPRSIAVIGASPNPDKVGYSVMRNLLPFDGEVYPVNPNESEILGRKVYPSISSISGEVDLAVVAVPAKMVPDIISEAGAKGAKLAVIISAGFRETGQRGKSLERKVLEAAKKNNVRIIGPNCVGIMLPHEKINTTFDPISPKPGHIAFISQSGAIITTVVDWSKSEEIGFSAVISVGNQADLGFLDFLKFAEKNEETKAIVLYIEEVRNGREFLEEVQKISPKKPVIALKSGASKRGHQAASSHTGSLAGSYEVYMAAFRQAGVLAAYSLKEAFLIAELTASEGYPDGNRAVVISNAGGFAVLASDYAEKYGVDLIDFSDEIGKELDSLLPKNWSGENPIDLIGDARSDRYANVFNTMIRNQDIWDIAFVISVPTAVLNPNLLANEVVRFSRNTHKMIVGCMLGGESVKSGVKILRDSHIPNFSELEDAFKIVGRIVQRTK
ncbi:MAG: acetate--CoA ligase family protein [Thermodesulfobacteriota bacterium]